MQTVLSGKRAVLLAIATWLAVFTTPANAIEKKLLIGSFDDIIVDGDMQVIVETGKAVSAKASGDQRVLDSLRLERTGMTLRIRMQDVINNQKGRPITEPLIVTITNRHVQNIVLKGSATLKVSEIKTPNSAAILLSGSGNISVGRVEADRFSADLLGNGKLSIGGGTARDGTVNIDGGAIYDAAGLQFRKLKLTQNGNATMTSSISEEAQISNSGSGNITIGGKGNCFIQKAGAAQIKCSKTITNRN